MCRLLCQCIFCICHKCCNSIIQQPASYCVRFRPEWHNHLKVCCLVHLLKHDLKFISAFPTTPYLNFSAYEVICTTIVNGACAAIAGPSITVSPAFTVPIPTTTCNSDQFKYSTENSFVAFVGLPTCAGGNQTATVSQSATTPLAAAPSSSAVSPSPTSSLIASGDVGLSSGAKIGIGVGTLVGVVLIAVAAFIYSWKTRRTKRPPADPPELGGQRKVLAQEADGFERPCESDRQALNEMEEHRRHEMLVKSML